CRWKCLRVPRTPCRSSFRGWPDRASAYGRFHFHAVKGWPLTCSEIARTLCYGPGWVNQNGAMACAEQAAFGDFGNEHRGKSRLDAVAAFGRGSGAGKERARYAANARADLSPGLERRGFHDAAR